MSQIDYLYRRVLDILVAKGEFKENYSFKRKGSVNLNIWKRERHKREKIAVYNNWPI